MHIILASASPRRKEILENLGLTFTCLIPDLEEKTNEITADGMVRDLSSQKASAAKQLLSEQGNDCSDTLIIASDTAVVCDMNVLGKPKNKKQATEMLSLLSGRTHFVTTGITLIYEGRVLTDNELTKIRFVPLSRELIEAYVTSNEPMDKAGAYGIQGLASCFVESIEGDYFNVVGFPVHKFCQMLEQLGLRYLPGKGIAQL